MTKLIISGASTTQGVWPTWADILCERYTVDAYNVAVKGLGNEAIILRALSEAARVPGDDKLIVIMLTCVDKWDWYIDKPDLLSKFEKEKHTITRLSPSDTGGFWGTGSWFPLEKSVYKEMFYSDDYFVMRTLQMIGLFKQVCESNNWQYRILFDSPIFSLKESELNLDSPLDYASNKLVNSSLNQWLYQLLDLKDVFEPGLVGFLYQNNMPWYSPKYKSHPGTYGNYLFASKFLFPELDKMLPIKNTIENVEEYAKVMDKLWTA